MEKEQSLIVSRALFSQIGVLTKFVVAMAVESENYILYPERTARAIKIIFENPKYGIYISASKGDSIAGSLLITFEYNYIKNRVIYWIQSVYTHPDFRHQGVYTSNYKYVLKEAKDNNVYSVKLFIDYQNTEAETVYKKLGMTKTPELMLVLRTSKKIEDSGYDYDDRDKLSVKGIDTKLFEQSKRLGFKHVLGEKGTAVNYDGLLSIVEGNDVSEVLVVECGGSLLALVGIFFEYSDWFNVKAHYIYDMRIVDSVEDRELEKTTAAVLTKVVQAIVQRQCKAIRIMLASEYEWMEPMIKKHGFGGHHYLVYEQVL